MHVPKTYPRTSYPCRQKMHGNFEINPWTNKITSGQFYQYWTIHPWTNYFRTIYPWGQSMHGQIKLS